MRPIDADYLVNVMIHNCPIEEGGIPVKDFATHNRILAFYPTIDAVPVVRCKDCEYWMYEYDDVGLCVVDVPDVDGVERCAHDFYSHGERRDDAENH